jgi:hypothetical protein
MGSFILDTAAKGGKRNADKGAERDERFFAW